MDKIKGKSSLTYDIGQARFSHTMGLVTIYSSIVKKLAK